MSLASSIKSNVNYSNKSFFLGLLVRGALLKPFVNQSFDSLFKPSHDYAGLSQNERRVILPFPALFSA
jgi:hypothetical protein